ncbi:alkaline phosphatase PafA [Pontimicrobium aquaticum]|uniref:glycerophosphocholine cholinephosphodiesterase n=1 Tax=Pontimicrobium aquaticum TaxID=2565367 RepID=A0A4U0EXB7_9FLAO|nr:alkaline phosphatase PafA [Pontimicrobium aquaticum]TJY36510.1 alkaline phosphatase family protein [Pontimicrobium aquaticum]
MKNCLLFILSVTLSVSSVAQVQTNRNEKIVTHKTKTKLVVGIVVDQMRYEYLTRFQDKFGDGGFMRMINDGFNCKNNHFNYVPTYTGPGHASVYTGTTPKYHGVISNSWYDKVSKKYVYCAGDDTVASVGTEDTSGQMSPQRMKTTTFADENRLFTQMRGKSIGISIKDRGAILPVGHTANAAYWFQGKLEGNFISSTFYMTDLPNWVKTYNKSNSVSKYMKVWNTLYDISTYVESGSDLNDFEGGFKGKKTATFPYDLKVLSAKNGGFDILKSTPYGNSIVADFAMAAIDGEQLGKDNITDVLAISFSSTDYVGHNFGVNSKEVQDTYLRLDKDLERLFNALDEKVGEGNYIVFLTADHGAVHVPSYLKSVKIPAGYVNSTETRAKFKAFLNAKYNSDELIESISNNQVFLNRMKIKELGLDLHEIQDAIVNEIITYNGVDKAYTAYAMTNMSYSSGIEKLIQNGFNQKRSGDVIYVNDPATISYSVTGSTHGSGFNYDTHVPLLFYGNGISNGSTMAYTRIIDIAPTISSILGISLPNGSTGQPIQQVFKEN